MSHECGSCTNPDGCTGRLNDARKEEEINSGPYLAFAALVIVAVSLAARWLLA